MGLALSIVWVFAFVTAESLGPSLVETNWTESVPSWVINVLPLVGLAAISTVA